MCQWFQLLDRANQPEKLLVDQWAALGEFDRDHRIKLAIDEWGCWHPEDKRLPETHLFAQYSTMRDALVAGLTLDTFHRHGAKRLAEPLRAVVGGSLTPRIGFDLRELSCPPRRPSCSGRHCGFATDFRMHPPGGRRRLVIA